MDDLITDSVWKTYVDTGDIPDVIIFNIVKRLVFCEELSIRQQSIYITYSKEIESLIKEVNAHETRKASNNN